MFLKDLIEKIREYKAKIFKCLLLISSMIPLAFGVYSFVATLPDSELQSLALQTSAISYKSIGSKGLYSISAKSGSKETAALINKICIEEYSVYHYRSHYDSYVAFRPEHEGPFVTIGNNTTQACYVSLPYFTDSSTSYGYQIENSTIHTMFKRSDVVSQLNGTKTSSYFIYISKTLADTLIQSGQYTDYNSILGQEFKVIFSENGVLNTYKEIVLNIYYDDKYGGASLLSNFGMYCLVGYDSYTNLNVSYREFLIEFGSSEYFNYRYYKYLFSRFSPRNYEYKYYSTSVNGVIEQVRINSLFAAERQWDASTLRVGLSIALCIFSILYFFIWAIWLRDRFNASLGDIGAKNIIICSLISLFISWIIVFILGHNIINVVFFSNLGHSISTMVVAVVLILCSFFAVSFSQEKKISNV
jgi:hypothetical protein